MSTKTFDLTRWAAMNPQLVKPGTFSCPNRDTKFRLDAAELRRRMHSGFVPGFVGDADKTVERLSKKRKHD